MKKKLILLAMCLVMVTGCGEEIPKLKDGSEAVVNFEDGSSISAEELYAALKENAGTSTMVNLIDRKILEQEYKDKVTEAEEYTTDHMAQLNASYGEDLLSAIQQYTGYATIEAYEDSVSLSFLQNEAILDYAKSMIKDKDVEEYYDDEIVGDIKISHILITPNVTDDMSADEKSDAEEEAKEEIEDIIAQLKKADKDEIESLFAELAKEESQDSSTASSGGNLGFINTDTLGTTYDELVDAAYDLEDGEYSTKVITTELGYHVVLRTESKEKASLEDSKEDILEILANEYLTENIAASTEAMRDLREEYGMDIIDTQLNDNYATLIQNALLQAEEQEAAADAQ